MIRFLQSDIWLIISSIFTVISIICISIGILIKYHDNKIRHLPEVSDANIDTDECKKATEYSWTNTYKFCEWIKTRLQI